MRPCRLQSRCDCAPDCLTLMCRAADKPTQPSQGLRLGASPHWEAAASALEGDSPAGDSPRQAVLRLCCQQHCRQAAPLCRQC